MQHGMVALSLLKGLMQVVSGAADESPNILVKALRDAFDLKACSFFSLNARAKLLTLRAQVGFQYGDYQSLILPLTSTAGRAVTGERLLLIDNLREAADYRDRTLIEKYSLVSGLFLPIPAPSDALHCSCLVNGSSESSGICAVLCLYPADLESALALRARVGELDAPLGQAYGHSVLFDRLRARDDILSACLPHRDFKGILHRLVHRLRDAWRFEAASVFLHDPRADLLRLAATTGIEGDLRRVDVTYAMHETDCRTVEAFRDATVINLHEPTTIRAGKYVEELAGERTGLLLVPIFEPTEHAMRNRRCLGVLRLVNRVLAFGDRREVTPFGWEDESFACFVAEIIGVLYFLHGKAVAKAEDFDRAIHGLQTEVLGTLSRLNQLIERSSVQASLEATPFRYHIPNAINQLDAAIWQLKLATGELTDKTLTIRPIMLLGDVLASVVAQIPKYANVLNTPPARSPCYNHDDLQRCPTILADAEALTNILRCLVENALKYTKPGAPFCELAIYWAPAVDAVDVFICDQGIGVDRKDRPYLFREGFRTEDARRRHPAGLGIGLATARQLAELMNGKLELCPPDKEYATRFRLRLPTQEMLK